MSLQVWLPLNGDLQNLGLSNDEITVLTNLEYTDNGKIGKALSYGSIKMSAKMSKDIFNNQQFSFCCWVYVNAETGNSSNRAMFFGNGDMGENNNRKFSIFQYPTCNDLHLSWQNDAANVTFLGGVWSSVFPSYKWTHVAVTYKNPTATIYINGQKIGTATGVSNSSSFEYETVLFANAPNHCKYLNDYRIYDHCLSLKEVKEISKGLIVHYPLNDMIGNENLFRETNLGSLHWGWSGNGGSRSAVSDGEGVILTTTKAANSGSWTCIYFSDSNIKNRIEANTTYTAQVDVWTNVAMTNFSFSIRDGNSLNVLLMNDYGIAVPANTWTHVIWHGTSVNDLPISSQCGYLAGTPATTVVGNIVKLKNFKLEKGSVATPWIPNPVDALYSELGLDDNIVYDCSGYGHNGTKTSTGISCSSDSPRYSSCMDFETSGYINAGTGGKVTDEITISGWVYENPWTADPHPWSCTQGGGWNIQNSNNKPTFPIYVNTVGYVHSISGDISTPLWTDLSPGWHLFTGTYDGFNVKLYIDGELVANKATGKTDKLPIHYHATNSIFLHREATATGSTGSYAACKLSDVRIYATALSDEDIKELYETSASIDNHGNMWAYEIQEV